MSEPSALNADALCRRQAITTAAGLISALLLGGCTTPPKPTAPEDGHAWAGRLSLQIDSTPPQHFSAGFELSGAEQQGELVLSSPLGQQVASARWNATGAWLVQGERRLAYPDMAALTSATTGAALPLGALFRWLQGDAAHVDGWEADLSRHHEGRLSARRLLPEPRVQLRIVFQ